MKVTEELIDHLSHLARLSFEGEAKERLKKDLERIIVFLDQLNDVNTEGIEPLIFLTNEVNQIRKDTNIQVISKSEALKNAPKKDSDYFRIAKVKGKVNP